tara:strand:+ start:1097 stop:1723 length:627 start_codon:yes stop_codon:yes gene_type:complete
MKPRHIIVFLFALSNLYNSLFPKAKDCIMVSEGGYSGFWYYYGKIQKEYILDKKIYCFSAGCLAVVANIQHNNKEFLFTTVDNLKNQYDNNNIDRYNLRNYFIYEIANKVTDIKNYNLNILTSNYFGNCTIITPTTKNELIDALNITTTLPLLTSPLYYNKNIDGYFCLNNYPRCETKLTIPNKLYFYINIFNPNINKKDIEYFMNYL